MATQTRTIRIKVDTSDAKGLTKLSTQMGKLNRNVKGIGGNLNKLNGVFNSFIALIGARELVRSIDSFQLLEDRIKVFTGSAEDASNVFDDLAVAAKLTKTSVDSLAQSYNRIALATQELGLSQDQILATTVALQQTFRLSGSSIAEATAATIQLSQGLSSGQLRGQELRSVVEQNAVLANLLSKELGIARGQLIKFAESGKITSDVVLNLLAKNFDKLNEDAQNLGTTIEQSLTIVLDALRLKLRDLNKEFNISGNFEKLAKIFVNNIDAIFRAVSIFVSSAVLVKLGTQFAFLFNSIKSGKGIGLTALIGRFNLLAGAMTAVALIGKKLGEAARKEFAAKDIGERIKRVQSAIEIQQKNIIRNKKALEDGGLIDRLFKPASIKSSQEQLKKLNIELVKLKKAQAQGKSLEDLAGGDGGGEENLFDKLSKSIKSLNVVIKTAGTGAFAELNKQYKEGAIGLLEYNEGVEAIKLEQLNKKFEDGKITVSEYNKELIQLNRNLQDTGNAGALDGIKVGAQQTAAEIGNIATQLSKITSATLNNLEDAIFDFVKSGKFAFKDFVQAVLDDLTRLVIRLQIIKPLAQAITTVPSANGNAFQNGNVIPFASGGVLSGPAVFPLAGGKTGLAGEAGPEAILPLTRGANGKLGVESSGGGGGVMINIINNSSSDVQQSESTGPNGEKQMELIIIDKVNKGLGEGKFDRTFKESFGVNRRGR